MPALARRGAPLAAALALVAATAGCGGGETPVPATAAKAATLTPGAAIPAPRGRALLTLSGAIGRTNRGRDLALSAATLKRLGLTKVSLYEPFKHRQMSFLAVPLSEVVTLASPSAKARTLHAVALNDYVVDLPLSIARGKGVWLALSNRDGSRIPIAQGGPIRVVFEAHARGVDVDNYWIWSLASVAVR